MREACAEVFHGGMPINYNDSGVAADVTERLVVRAWHYVAAVATHEAELATRDWWQNLITPC